MLFSRAKKYTVYCPYCGKAIITAGFLNTGHYQQCGGSFISIKYLPNSVEYNKQALTALYLIPFDETDAYSIKETDDEQG